MPSGAYNGTSTEKLELSDISNGQNSEMGSGKDGQGGCFLSLPMAFLLLLLAVAIAVGVGIIVHFAGASGRKIECDCKYPVAEPEPTPDWQKQWKDCNDLAVARNICLSVPHCQGGMTTPEPEGTTPEPTTTSAPTIDVRLPLNVYPLQYDLELIPDIYGPDPEKFTFSGNVNITVRCDKETDVITLHSNKLEVDVYAFDDITDSVITYKNKSMDLERQFLNIKLSGKLKVGNRYTVRMRFTGPLKDDLAGLYRSSYMRGNDTVHLATTQFQPTDARKTFPCFDEPAVKAKFRTTLVRKNHMKSLSNMPIETSEDRGGNWVADHYENTVDMSTYLLAFIICDFEYKEMNTSTGVTVRVWARPEAVNQTDYALDTGVKILEYFEQYFSIPFPLPKQDMIAVPDFAAGAMENWGLIIYRETALLYDPKVSSVGNKQRVAVVVSHELAHQWFGNLVTPLWWDDLWLNEGFASYVEYIGVDKVHPDWKMMEQIVTEDVQDVFKVDALGSSHPIYVPVSHPDEINEIFDRISYGKGASIIRMMQYYLGENTFRQGLTNYLNEKSYDAAFHKDLWAALTKQATADGKNINVSMVMDTWLLQMGFPVVTVTRKNTGVELSQKHFLIDPRQTPTDKYPSPFGYKWEVPFTYITSENPTWDGSHHLMHREDASLVNIFSKPTEGWIVGNVEEQGYYRVNYDYNNWDMLIEQLKANHTVFDVRNRAQFIDDAFNLGRAEQMDQLYGLRMTEYLEAEEEFLPWEATSVNLAYVGKMLGRSPSYGMYQEYLKKLVLPLYNSTGFQINNKDPHLTRYLRSIAINYACGSGYQPCIDEAKAMYKAWMEDPEANPVPPDLKTRVYCQGIKHGGQKEWDWAYQRHKVENVASESARLRYAMACTREPWMLSRYLEYTLMPSEIRKQDAVTTIVYISRNPVGRAMAWQFLRAKWEYIRNEYGTGFFSFTRLISGLTESFNTEFELQELKDFKAKYPDQGTATRAFSQAEETIRSNIRWMEKNEKNIADWLTEKTRGI